MHTATPHPSITNPTAPVTARVVSLRPHRAHPPHRAPRADRDVVPASPLLAWHDVREFAVGGFYREIPTGRIGRYMGPAEVHALDGLDISTVVLVFRCAATGQMYSYSQLDAQRGVAYEEVDE